MQVRRWGTAVLWGGMAVGGAFIGPAVAADTGACDFYQNQVLGAWCAKSVSVGVGASLDQFKTNQDLSAFVPGAGYWSRSNATNFSGTLAIRPASWLSLEFGTGYQKIAFKDQLVLPGFGTFGSNDHIAHNGFDTVGATFKLYDSGEGNTRFVLIANVRAGMQPPSTFFQREVEILGGIAAAAQVRLGQSDYSIISKAEVLGYRAATYNINEGGLRGSLLVSNDKYGIAAGPLAQAAYLHFPIGAAPETKAYAAGGQVVLSPFKTTSVPVLKDLVLQGTAVHSIGQAGFVTPSAGTASDMTYSGTATFSFKY